MRSKHALWNNILYDESISSKMTATTYHGSPTIRGPRTTRIGPQTPLRSQISSYGSPSVLRAEEDCVVIELGSRFLRVGLAGYAAPQTLIDFGLEQQRRAGDLRRWSSGYDNSRRSDLRTKGWAEMNELYRPDIRNLDLGLVGDKIERAVRNALTKTLLIDSRPRRMLLALPSILPLPLLPIILDTLFSNFQPPSISLMPTSILTTMAAGLRSALVVDIGWAETVVTTVCEYRELQCTRSIRASKMLVENIYKKLSSVISKASTEADLSEPDSLPSLEECEEVLERIIWCKSMRAQKSKVESPGLSTAMGHNDLHENIAKLGITTGNEEKTIITLPLNSVMPPKTIKLPFSEFSEPCETVLFAAGISEAELDEDELPLHLLLYRCLLKLTVDVRSICMARIIFVGGASQIPGLKTRVTQELSSLVSSRGWNRVSGKAVGRFLNNPKLQKRKTSEQASQKLIQSCENSSRSFIPASLLPQLSDPITERLRHEANRLRPVPEIGRLRIVNSLGAWAGGSLLSNLKVQPVTVIDREQWAQSGTCKSTKLGDSVLISQRHGAGFGNSRSGMTEKPGWTLGIWE